MKYDSKMLEPEVIQFFCLSGLGLCYQIFDYWSHCFMASFYHCMSAALYWVGHKIYFRKYLGIDVFAWGKGGTAVNRNRFNNNAARTPAGANAVGGIGAGEQVQDEQWNYDRNDNGNDVGDDGEQSLRGRDANIHEDVL